MNDAVPRSSYPDARFLSIHELGEKLPVTMAKDWDVKRLQADGCDLLFVAAISALPLSIAKLDYGTRQLRRARADCDPTEKDTYRMLLPKPSMNLCSFHFVVS